MKLPSFETRDESGGDSTTMAVATAPLVNLYPNHFAPRLHGCADELKRAKAKFGFDSKRLICVLCVFALS